LFKSVAIISRTDKVEAINLTKEISSHLEKKGITVRLDEEIADKLKHMEKITRDFDVELLITIGGDGTVLRAVHMTDGLIPIFPIRMGTVGFLCDADWDKSKEALDKLLRGEYVKDVCFTLESNLETQIALNEIRLGCPLPSHPVELEVQVDRFFMAKDRLDGIIVSTNTGASAYALSAGANLVDPRLEAMIVVPICALSTNFKPYIVPSSATITIKLLNESDLMTLIDGAYQKRLSGVNEIKISKSKRTVTFLRTGWNFYERLKRRLNISSVK
jgi:NAD+ kinase